MSRTQETLYPPVAALASPFGLPDVRAIVHAHALQTGAEPNALDLLSLDPATSLRCLRVAVASASVMTPPHDLSELTAWVGPTALKRAFDVAPVPMVPSTTHRTYWLHSLATAAAAELLAAEESGLQPSTAYLLGLLHDPVWWPRPVIAQRLALQVLARPGIGPLLAEATQLAVAAGFRHPTAAGQDPESRLISQQSIQAVGEAVRRRMQKLGLDFDVGGPCHDDRFRAPAPALFPIRREGPPLEMVLRLLESTDGARSRTVTAAATIAAVRYLGFDRAHLVRWHPTGGQLLVRSKTDFSRALRPPFRIRPNPDEQAVLKAALSGQAQVLSLDDVGEDGLLGALGASDAMVVKVTFDGPNASFLMVDRAWSGRRIEVVTDRTGVEALAGTTQILLENLRLRRRCERAERFALTDPLTRLATRNVGLAFLSQQLAARNRTAAPISVVMVDMDEFKKLNDSLGHLAGDRALRHTAAVLRRTLRKSDVICRYGGEEFLVVLPDTALEEASLLAARLAAAVQEAGEATRLPLSISLGLASANGPEETVESVLARADQALYASKASGRSRFSIDTGS